MIAGQGSGRNGGGNTDIDGSGGSTVMVAAVIGDGITDSDGVGSGDTNRYGGGSGGSAGGGGCRR